MDDRVDLLEATRQHLSLSLSDLWWDYFKIGGMGTQLEIEAVLYHALIPTDQDYDLLAVALNERSVQLGGGYVIPYSTDPDDWNA